jgi:hypothetical protein
MLRGGELRTFRIRLSEEKLNLRNSRCARHRRFGRPRLKSGLRSSVL